MVAARLGTVPATARRRMTVRQPSSFPPNKSPAVNAIDKRGRRSIYGMHTDNSGILSPLKGVTVAPVQAETGGSEKGLANACDEKPASSEDLDGLD